MITIIYCEDGTPVSDFNYKKFIDSIKKTIEYYDEEGKYLYRVSTFIPIEATRVAIKNKEIDCNKIQFMYNNTIIKVDKNGNLSEWPDGFGTLIINLLCQLAKR